MLLRRGGGFIFFNFFIFYIGQVHVAGRITLDEVRRFSVIFLKLMVAAGLAGGRGVWRRCGGGAL